MTFQELAESIRVYCTTMFSSSHLLKACLLVVCCSALSAAKRPLGPSYTFAASSAGFKAWMLKHGKTYSTEQELEKR